ncbi:MAG: AAA family ATPase [Myxococcota bacterium]|nr:AAA family ATPase [Myxococcota bacterium]
MGEDPEIVRERASNLWSSFERKFPMVSKATRIEPNPQIGVEDIGGLETAKEEVLTYACAATDPEVYARWGTFPPSALLLIGNEGVGKTLLARALATRTGMPFARVMVPRMVVEVIHRGGKIGEIVEGWSQMLAELPAITIFFEELEFSQTQEIGARRPDLPVGPIMDFLLDLLDRTILAHKGLVVGSTSHPDTLRTAFLAPGRFERVVEVKPRLPDDIVAALTIHAAAAEKRAGRPLFDAVDWDQAVSSYHGPSTGAWIRLMHAVLRRKARAEAAGEATAPASTDDVLREVERYRAAQGQLPPPGGGVYL